MNSVQKFFINGVSDEMADNLLLNITIEKMRSKLALKRKQGVVGWHNNCSIEHLKRLLYEHVEKGDMIDVMNIAGMIHIREQLDK